MKSFSFNEKFIFFSGFIVKIILGSIFASYFLSNLFIPFISFFVIDFDNPYAAFASKGAAESFPYPALMLFVLSFPIIIAEFFVDLRQLPEQLSYFLFRLPLLAADLGIFIILRSWLGKQNLKKLMLLYWFSPALLYITFIHGQLDVIPIFLLFLCLDFLFKKKIIISSIVFGLALSTKTMIILSLPFICLYLISKEARIYHAFVFSFFAAATFIVINISFIFDPLFQQMVFFNSEQGKIFEIAFQIDRSFFYLIPACILILLARGMFINNFNRDIFLMFLGFAFGIILLFVSPMPGWYFWLIPFLTYFYAKSDDNSYIFLILLQVAYLLYFGLIPSSDYWAVSSLHDPGLNFHDVMLLRDLNPSLFQGLAYTFLQVTLAVNCMLIYQKGINSYSKHKITSKPFLLGIGGNSGAGKTTIAEGLSAIFSQNNTTVIQGDDMHKWQRGHEKWSEYTHLDPKANLLHQEVGMLNNLKLGKKILRKTYDHLDGTFKNAGFFQPSNLTIFEGLHPFYLARQRHLYDLKIFIDPHKDLSLHWKIMRDVAKRGHTKEVILQNLEERAQDSKNYIESQAKYADIVIYPNPINPIKDIGSSFEEVEIEYQVIMPNSTFLESIIDSLASIETLNTSQEYLESDQQKISISGLALPIELREISDLHIPGLMDLGIDYPDWPHNSFGILMLLLTYYIFQEAEHGRD